ncbi:MAG TPA: efflux RND transporter periplasmic adaptor subunit [Terriglobales bacterium]|nr:efflux RND transporter periplasmic adaptor subunit [Terriglobales bacterium]
MRKWPWLVFGAVLLAAFFIFFRSWGKNAKAANADVQEPTVAVALVKRGTIANSLTLSGAFRPYQQVDVRAKVAGYIREIYVDVGDHVKAGQGLAILEVPELNAQVVGAKADIERYRDAIRRSQSEIDQAQSTHIAYHSAYARLKQASESRPGLIAEQELDDAMAKDKESEAQTESARAALAESQSQLAVAQADLDRLSALEAYSHITAPFAGVVTKRYADTGALIQAGTASETQSMPVVQLAECSRLRLVVPVPESAVPQLKLGSIVQVHVAAMNRDFEGKVARFADSLNEETRTMHTEIDVENPDGALKEGMYAEARIMLQRHNDALTVPIQALDRNSSGASVMIVDRQGRIAQRQVTLGVESSTLAEVLSGLSENERVVMGNRGEFHPGEKVTPKVVELGGLEAEGS